MILADDESVDNWYDDEKPVVAFVDTKIAVDGSYQDETSCTGG